MIQAHGGRLVNRLVPEKDKTYFLEKQKFLKKLVLNPKQLSDFEMIVTGGFSPLEGFMNKQDYISVISNWRLSDGTVWSVPICLDVDKDFANTLKVSQQLALYSEDNEFLGIIEIEDKYEYDKVKEAKEVYKTIDEKHPGVKETLSKKEVYIAGKIYAVNLPKYKDFLEYMFTPQQTRKKFEEFGWKTVVGFQTRNPIHRAHEYLIKCALEIVDGAFIHPIVGWTKDDDIPAEVRMKCYSVLIENYFPKNRVFLCVNPAYMRYAGPREAIFHAIVRKNYGCTHFIVGRDHAGVGNYYGPYDAQRVFFEFKPEEIGITPLFFENAFYCKKCANMATSKTCPHDDNYRVFLSGTKVRELLKNKQALPEEFTRKEISEILVKQK